MQIKRTTTIIDNVNLRKENHGEDLVKAFDISMRMTTTQTVLDSLIPVAKGEDQMRKVIFDDKGYPKYEGIYPLCVHDKLEACFVTIYEGKKKQIKFSECNLASIKATPIYPHKVQLEFKVQGVPTQDVGERLWGMIKKEVDVSVTKQQGELPL